MYPFPPPFRTRQPSELPECSLIGIECPFKLPSSHRGGGRGGRGRGEERNNGKYRGKEVYKCKRVRLYVLNEERRQGDCSPASDLKLRFSLPHRLPSLPFFPSLACCVSITSFSFFFFNFQIRLRRKSIPPLAPSQVSELSTRYSQGALLKRGIWN